MQRSAAPEGTSGKKVNRGRVRRLSLATTESKQEETGVVSAKGPASSPAASGGARRRKRVSLISGELGGDAGFECDKDTITFYDGAQIDDGANLRMAGSKSDDVASMAPPVWLMYGAFSRAGFDGVARKTNQDAYVVCPHFHGNPAQFLFGVYDGHGTEGHFVSRAVTRMLPKHVASKLPEGDTTPLSLEAHGEALRHGYVQSEEDLFQSPVDTTLSGTTAVTVLLRGKRMLIANAGDSRCVVGRRAGGKVEALALTVDHKPETPAEKSRIEAAEGVCRQLWDEEYAEFIGPVRVWSRYYQCKSPGIAMSRSIGDMVATEVGVIADPELTEYELVTGRDAVVILASDGVWEFMSDQDAVDLAMKHYGKPRDAAVALCDESTRRWKEEEDVIDDISACVWFINEKAEAEAAKNAAKAAQPADVNGEATE